MADLLGALVSRELARLQDLLAVKSKAVADLEAMLADANADLAGVQSQIDELTDAATATEAAQTAKAKTR